MSFIMQTIRCKNCGHEMNIATGTFGYGVSKECPECEDSPLHVEVISYGWNAQDGTV
jgi:hypothetical protein